MATPPPTPLTDPRRPTRSTAFVLEFERPIIELEGKIQQLEADAKPTAAKSKALASLRKQLEAKVKEIASGLTPIQTVQLARHRDRPLTSDYVASCFEDFVELHGDREFGNDRAILTGLARIGAHRVMVIGHRKGKDLKEKMACNYGCAHPEGYRKAMRKMRFAEKFGLPIVTFINTPGAYPGIGAEERGQAWAIAEAIRDMSGIRVPIVCTVIGEGGSGGALGIGVGDKVLMLENAYYSVISPEGCAAILWGDAKRAPEAAKALKLTAKDLLGLGIVDEIVPEPVGGAHRDHVQTFETVKGRITGHLDALCRIPIQDLLDTRYGKFRQMGAIFPPADESVRAAATGASARSES